MTYPFSSVSLDHLGQGKRGEGGRTVCGDMTHWDHTCYLIRLGCEISYIPHPPYVTLTLGCINPCPASCWQASGGGGIPYNQVSGMQGVHYVIFNVIRRKLTNDALGEKRFRQFETTKETSIALGFSQLYINLANLISFTTFDNNTHGQTMFSSTLRPIARTALRNVNANARSYSSSASRSTSGPMIRNLVLGGSALATISYLVSQRGEVRLDSKVPRESVLDGHTLKEPIHRRDGMSPHFFQDHCSTSVNPAGAAGRFAVCLCAVTSETGADLIGGEKEKSETPKIVQSKSTEAEETKGPEGAFNEETGEINWDCPVCPRPVPRPRSPFLDVPLRPASQAQAQPPP